MVRIEPAKGPLDLQARRDDDPIDIDRPGAQAQRRQDRGEHAGVDGLQSFQTRLRERTQPATHRARRRHHPHRAESLKQRIVLQVGDMPQPAAADDQQADQQTQHGDHPKVAPTRRARERLPHRRVEADPRK